MLISNQKNNIINLFHIIELINPVESTQQQTPLSLIEEMLSLIPIEYFRDKSKKFLDPCFGSGKFLLYIILMLDENLKTIIPDNFIRRKHILTEQIYGYEIDNIQKMFFLSSLKRLNWFVEEDINSYNIFKNIIINDFLNMKEDINKMKFDIIIGNPPYQSPVPNAPKLWPKFVNKVLTLNPTHIVFITPTSWAYGAGKDFKEVRNKLKNKLKFADLNCSKYFPNVGDDISMWHWDINHNGKTEIITKNEEKKFHDFNLTYVEDKYLPFKTIYEKVLVEKKSNIPTLINNKDEMDKLSDKKSKGTLFENGKYIVQYGASQILYVNSEPKNYYHHKVFINRSGHYWISKNPDKYIKYMFEGVAGDLGAHVLVTNEIEAYNLINILRSKLFIVLIQFNPIKNNQFKDDIYKIPLIDYSKNWTNEELYSYFNLTEKEILFIEDLYNNNTIL